MMIPINALRCLGIDKSIFVLRSLMLISARNGNLVFYNYGGYFETAKISLKSSILQLAEIQAVK